jgi:MFS family permease
VSDSGLPAAASPSATAPAPGSGRPLARIGFLEFAPGITRLNGWTFLYLNFMIMPIVSFLSFSQGYVLKEMVAADPAEIGRTTSYLVTMQELVALCLVGYAAALSDRFGRRPVYAFGVLVAGLGFALYGAAASVTELYVYRFIYAIGISFAGVMIAVTAADYPSEASRGKLAGISGFLSRLPSVFQGLGYSNAEAGKYMLWALAGLAVTTAVVMHLGLAGGTPTGRKERLSMLETLRIGLRQGSSNPRLVLCYAGAFVSRADLTLIATFVSLWLQEVARGEGLDGPAALLRAGLMTAIIQGVSLLWAPIAGILLDRFHRLACVVGSLLVAGVGYTLFGLQVDPFTPLGYFAAALVGMGQMSCILSSTALIGQESPINARGPVIGFASLAGNIGILATTFIGGFLFDRVAISAPIVLTGVANLLVFALALRIWLKDGRPTRFDPAEARSGTTLDFGH